MTASLVAVVTDVVRDGRPVVGYGFNSNGRYGQGGLIRERFVPRPGGRAREPARRGRRQPRSRPRSGRAMMTNEKPGGHGERSVAVGTIDMAVWDAVAKIAGKPLFRLLAERHGGEANPRVFVYAAGGYYYPGKDDAALRAEMRGYLDRGYTVVKMKIGGAPIDEDRGASRRCWPRSAARRGWRWTPMAASISRPRIAYAKMLRQYRCSGTRRPAIRSTTPCRRRWPSSIPARWPRAKTCSPSGRAQPHPLRRHAAGPRLAAVRLRAVLRAVSSICARLQCCTRRGWSPRALHSARRASDVAEYRRRARTWRQRELSRPVPALSAASPTACGSRTATSPCRSFRASVSRASLISSR